MITQQPSCNTLRLLFVSGGVGSVAAVATVNCQLEVSSFEGAAFSRLVHFVARGSSARFQRELLVDISMNHYVLACFGGFLGARYMN